MVQMVLATQDLMEGQVAVVAVEMELAVQVTLRQHHHLRETMAALDNLQLTTLVEAVVALAQLEAMLPVLAVLAVQVQHQVLVELL